MQLQSIALVVLRPLNPEDLGAFRVQQTPADELVDPRAFRKRGIQADSWIRPQPTLGEFRVDLFPNALVTNRDEARDVRPIVVDQPATEFEYVHGVNGWFSSAAARLCLRG